MSAEQNKIMQREVITGYH